MNDLHDLFDWFWFETLNGESSTGRARLVGPVLNGVFLAETEAFAFRQFLLLYC